jgi:excisionase family DNA binding protein
MKSQKSQRKPALSVEIESKYLRVHAAADYIGCTVWAVRSAVWAGELSYIKVGGRLLFDRADLDVFVVKRRVAAG